MARKKAEIDLLGVATKEELVKFEVGKQNDKELAVTVSQINRTSSTNNVLTEEELLRIKKKGEQEILEIQNELKEFKMNEERKIAFLPIEEDEEEKEEYIPTRREKIVNTIKKPFVTLVDMYDEKTRVEKFNFLRNFIIIIIVLIFMTLTVFAAKKYKLVTDDYIKLNLKEVGAGLLALPLQDLAFNDDFTTLTRVEIDGQNTVFTFDTKIDFKNKFSAVIVDSDGFEYPMDYHYMENIKPANAETVLAMESLRDGIKRFNLIIRNKTTGEECEYQFMFEKFLEKSDFIKLYNLKNIHWAGLNVDNFFTSSTGSVLNYSLSSKGLDYKYKIIESTGMHSNIYENGNIIPSKQHKTIEFDFPEENAILYQEFFSQPKDFTSLIKFKSEDIFKSYSEDIIISREQAQQGVKLDYGQYSLYIEGIQKKGDMAILVYHCVDNNFNTSETKTETEAEAEPSNFSLTETPAQSTERIYTILDVDILIYNNNGEVVNRISPSKINVSDKGADVVYVDDRLNYVVNNFYINIKSVNIRDSIYTSDIDLSDYKIVDRDTVNYEKTLLYVENIFLSRLAYKATERPRNDIFGFNKEILDDRVFMQRYMPINLKERANYSVEILASAAKSNKVLMIVEERFVADSVQGYINEIVQHRVVYDLITNEITLDVIIE